MKSVYIFNIDYPSLSEAKLPKTPSGPKKDGGQLLLLSLKMLTIKLIMFTNI